MLAGSSGTRGRVTGVTRFVGFDDVWPNVLETLQAVDPAPIGSELLVVRDLFGRVRLVLPEQEQQQPDRDKATLALANALHSKLGAHSYEPERATLTLEPAELETLRTSAIRYKVGAMTVYLIDRLVTGTEWASVAEPPETPGVDRSLNRFTLFSLKGGVGRSTTAAVLAGHLAQNGRRVLVLDLDLESPGVSSALLSPEEHPDWGIVDWFVEDLVGQGETVLGRMVGRPRWAQNFPGEILVVPAHGQDPKEYLSKLGRVYLDRPPVNAGDRPERWTKRLVRLIEGLEARHRPDVVILDSRSGLHDLAAAAVTDVYAHVFLFGMDSAATWVGYEILFRHWKAYGIAPRIRERLSMVAALIPETGEDEYIRRFRERAWDLFREELYDEIPADQVAESGQDWFSFDLMDESGPHNPIPVYWNRGLAAVPNLRDLEQSSVAQAYRDFLKRFDQLWSPSPEDRP